MPEGVTAYQGDVEAGPFVGRVPTSTGRMIANGAGQASRPGAISTNRIAEMMQASATVLHPKDRTSAERSRRYRRNKKAAATAATQQGVTVSTVDMCALSARLAAGRVTVDDLQIAGRLIWALVHLLPADSSLTLPS
jgi:hypothetical protein